MSITNDFIKYLKDRGHKVVDRRGKAMGGNTHNRSLSGLTTGGQHWDGVANGTIEGHERHWRNSLGWNDGGYTAFVEDNGTVNVNYDFEKRTNGVGNHNTPTLNFCYGGTWSNPITDAQLQALTNMWTFVVNDSRTNINSFNDVLGHKEFSGHSSNACPGLDMNEFRNDISQGSSNKVANTTAPKQAQGAKLVKYENEKFTVTDPLGIKVRNAPSTSATHTGDLEKGDSIVYDRVYEGGGYRWLSYVSYSGSRLYVPYRPSNDVNNQWGTFGAGEDENTNPGKYVSGAELVKYEDGTFTVTDSAGIKVRNNPTTQAKHTGTLPQGTSIVYDRVYEGGGYRWLSYTGGSGNRLYVPYRPLDDINNQWGTFS